MFVLWSYEDLDYVPALKCLKLLTVVSLVYDMMISIFR
jgi:hypothetical protein